MTECVTFLSNEQHNYCSYSKDTGELASGKVDPHWNAAGPDHSRAIGAIARRRQRLKKIHASGRKYSWQAARPFHPERLF